MRRWIIAGLSFVPFFATPVAAGVIDGTWKVDLGATQLPRKPDVYLLANGRFACSSCTPAFTIKADGALHPVAGHDYYDATSVRVIDAHTIAQLSSKRGKVVFKATNVVSADGKTLTYEFVDTSAPSGVPVSGKGVETLVAPGPAGAHAISGAWRTTSMAGLSDSGMTISFKTTPGTVTMTTPTAQTYTARYGGPAVPIKGDPAMTMAAVTRAGTNGFVETDTRKGKVVSVMHISVAPDGRTMTAVVDDTVQGTTTTFKAIKQ
jgi:hypothetical protein